MTSTPPTQTLTPTMAFLMRYRMQISFVLLSSLLAVNIFQGGRPHAVLSLHDPIGLVGAIIALMGALTRSWAAGVVHKEARLATTGPYFFLRHPLYFGSLLMAIGMVLILSDWKFALAVVALILVIYVPKIRNEERALGRKFGKAWSDYIAVTPRIFPRLAWPKSWSDWSYQQWLFNREYNGLSGCLFALALFEVWSRY